MVVGNYYVNALLHQWKLFLRTHDVCRKKLSDSFDESFQSVTEVKHIGCELDVYGLTMWLQDNNKYWYFKLTFSWSTPST